MARPTEMSAWAESAPPEDISEPSGERAEGYKAYEPWPHGQANWLFRALFRWISWLTLKSDTHKHDGLGGDLSAPQIEANTDLFWGGNGRLEASPSALEHLIDHVADSGVESHFKSDKLTSRGSLNGYNAAIGAGGVAVTGDISGGDISGMKLTSLTLVEAANTPAIRAAHWKIENDTGADAYVVVNGEPNAIGIASITDNRSTIANGASGLRTLDISLANGPLDGTVANGFNTIVQVTPSGLGMPDRLFVRATYSGATGVRVTITDDAGMARETDFYLSVYHV